ncbi:aminotransferase class I/II-fold pyridoxal phosphate-dependent enzyme [Rhodonellum sp.]|uniref:aminotransferase class I/II-fold pyridoxal phosphate-dependent enzyme n=1 Tax=Rhodonellum sp. TaxID=2231180 RepID=UPI002725A803|nr:aminotransferase class I/II-fold pyridoxal phosphate-dependent enzyme [Rhodonellum sp.]MDO9551477.1 aminotransferase class I/II-fold pyridoxal phosphate-dependent enzyme [Rhodonellum sp.]
MPPKIWLSSPHMGGQESVYVQEAFDTNWIAPIGPHLTQFENNLSKISNGFPVAALSSGTAALHLALVMLNVQPGDYVICQSLTFAASANPIRYQGAVPVFVDSEEDTWNMCPEALEEAIKACMDGSVAEDFPAHLNLDAKKGKKPKAIIPVHLYGMPAKMDQIMEIANRYGIPVVEDAAEALGSNLNGQACGTFGEFGVYSFNGNKIITTSGGGALLGPEVNWIDRARYLATQARTPAAHYQHVDIGYNYRLSNVSAAIGLGQLEVLSERVAQRRENFSFYRQELTVIPGISMLPELEGYYANRWLSAITVDPSQTHGKTRETIRLALEEENIESRPIWKPMHLQPVFENYPYYGAKRVSEKIFEDGLCLPSGSNLEKSDLVKTVEMIKQLLG